MLMVILMAKHQRSIRNMFCSLLDFGWFVFPTHAHCETTSAVATLCSAPSRGISIGKHKVFG